MGFLHWVGFLLVLIGASLWCVSGRLCYFEQEPNPEQRGSLRWVLPLDRQDLCSCSETRPGGVNTVITNRAFQPYYTDHPIFTDNQEIIHTYFKCHGDCHDKLHAGYKSSGVYTIYPPQYKDGLRVYCKMGITYGWIVFHRRFKNGTINFNRTWDEYKAGFGILTGEFWLGNEILQILTNGGDEWETWTVRMDLKDKDDRSYSHKNFPFRVSDKNYTMHVGTLQNICTSHRLKNNAFNITVSGNAVSSRRWSPNSEDENLCFRIVAGEQIKVTGVFMKGQEMQYQVEYSYNNIMWKNITANGSPMKLKSNSTGVKNMFGMANKTRYVRIKPEGSLNQSLRIVPIGCKVYSSFRNRIAFENGVLRNENINASSSGNNSSLGCLTRYARLSGDQNKGWCPAPDDRHPWLQMDLGKTMAVQGVTLKGGDKGWVKKYRVEYRCCVSDAKLQNVTESPHSNKTFTGTCQRSKKVMSNFYEPIKAHVIRIIPIAFDGEFPVMSVELIGTEGDNMLDNADKQPFSTYDQDNDGGDENCASMAQQGWWYNDHCNNTVVGFDQIVKVEYKIRKRFPN